MSAGTLKDMVLSVFGLAVIIAVSLVVIWPIWYVATTWTEWYTALVILAVVLASVYGIVIKVQQHARDNFAIPPPGLGNCVPGVAEGDASEEP